jgi:predicted nuclease of predicted toxin-antitoxin system
VGVADASDEEILSYAARERMVIFTHDLDFGALLARSGADVPRVVQLREADTNPARVGERMVESIAQCADLLEQGALVTVDLRRSKARALPFTPDSYA